MDVFVFVDGELSVNGRSTVEDRPSGIRVEIQGGPMSYLSIYLPAPAAGGHRLEIEPIRRTRPTLKPPHPSPPSGRMNKTDAVST
jgi:hypothetical protein